MKKILTFLLFIPSLLFSMENKQSPSLHKLTAGTIAFCLRKPEYRKILSSLPLDSQELIASEMQNAQASNPVTYINNKNYIDCVNISPDNTKIVSAHGITIVKSKAEKHVGIIIKIWNALTSQCLGELKGHISPIRSLNFSPDSTQIVSASCDKTIKIWDIETGKCIRTLLDHTGVNSVNYNHNGTMIVSASFDGTIKIWDASTGQCLRILTGHKDSCVAAKFSSCGSKIISCSNINTPLGIITSDAIIKLWDALTGECLNTFIASPKNETFTVWFNDRYYDKRSFNLTIKDYNYYGAQVTCILNNGKIKQWNVLTGNYLETFLPNEDYIHSASFNSNGTQIALAARKNGLTAYNRLTAKYSMPGYAWKGSTIQFSADSAQIIEYDDDQAIKVWQLFPSLSLDYKLVLLSAYETLDPKIAQPLTLTGPRNVNTVKFNHDGTQIIIDFEMASILKCLDIFSGHWSNIPKDPPNNFCSPSNALQAITLAQKKNIIKIINILTKKTIRKLTGHTANVNSAQFNADGTNIISASDDKTIKIWSAITGECLETLTHHTNPVKSAYFSPNGTKIVSLANNNTIKLWQLLPSHCDNNLVEVYNNENLPHSYNNFQKLLLAGSAGILLAHIL